MLRIFWRKTHCFFEFPQDFCSDFPDYAFDVSRLSTSPYLTPSLRFVALNAISHLKGKPSSFDHKLEDASSNEDVEENGSEALGFDGREENESVVLEGLTLMLPLIETVLRIRFAIANGCPKRLLTAECAGK